MNILLKIHRMMQHIERFCALISGLAILCLLLLATYSVGGRQIANHPVAGYVDWIEQFMPIIACMGIAYVQANFGHIRMDMLITRLKGRALWCVEAITTVFILLFVSFVVWGAYAHFQRSFDITAPAWSNDSSIDIGLPIWPAKLTIAIALSLLIIRLSLQLIAYIMACIHNQENEIIHQQQTHSDIVM